MSCRSQPPHRHGSLAADMPLRMRRYYTDIRLAGHSGPIRQFLIHIGADRLTMPAGLGEPDLLAYRYSLVDMHRADCAGLLAQDNPDALVLAVLCDFGDRRPKKSSPTSCAACESCWVRTSGVPANTSPSWRFSRRTGISRHRFKEAEHMLTEIDIESLPSFAIGFERGGKKGEERGLEEGKAQVVHRLLSRLGVAEVSKLFGLSEEVKRIAASSG